jgi:glucose/arabinose dehydrogenase
MRHLALGLVIFATWLGGCDGGPAKPQLPAACETPVSGTAITFRFVAETQEAALLVTSPPDDIRRFVVEQQGRVKIITDTGLVTFLDVSNDIACCGEQGLLGLAFHPKYATNGRFFVFYTTSDANVIVEYKVSATDPNAADPASKKVLLTIDDFATNHNGGMMEFGPDGKLYVGTGDGGGGGDPNKNGQNPTAQLGKLLRLDVDAATPAPENYAIGLRNPWRWAFDPANGDLYIGDVGQGELEELDFIPAGTPAGVNFGWSMYEGSNCFTPPCDATSKTMPVYEETHGDGWCSVIGGQVYRGSCYPDIAGTYFFTDYCTHELVSAKKEGTTVGGFTTLTNVSWIDKDGATHAGMPSGPSSLHQDARGELFLTLTGTRGGVYHLEAGP